MSVLGKLLASPFTLANLPFKSYRQYYGNQSVSFHERKSGFDVVIGNNGAGKSNLLNSVYWCFYKNEPNLDSGQSIVNEQYFDELPTLVNNPSRALVR